METAIEIVVIVSANVEWDAVRKIIPGVKHNVSPFGTYFLLSDELPALDRRLIMFHGGWGKISAAASAQYAIDRWQPELLINLGTCGGFGGKVERGDIILVNHTVVYDIFEQMGDISDHIAHYTIDLDLSWLRKPYPEKVLETLLVSGDRDLIPEEIKRLNRDYGAVAGDWESGAIAYVANRNKMPLLILRGVSDLVSESGGEAYGDREFFVESAASIVGQLIHSLPNWIERVDFFKN